MNINDYSTKVKNLANVLTSIGAPIDDEDLMLMTSNGLGRNYSQFRISIAIPKTFFDFQNLITLLISEDMKIVGTSSNGGSHESALYSNINRGTNKSGKTSFWGQHGSFAWWTSLTWSQPHGSGWGNFRGRGGRGGRGGSHWGEQLYNDSNWYYCEKHGHMAMNYYQREHDARNGKLQQGNYASTNNQSDE